MGWGALGDHYFETIAGPTDETLKIAVEYAEQPVLDIKSRLQFMGQKLQEMALQIRLSTSINSMPELDLRAFKDDMEAGQILGLALGDQPDSGIWAGWWVIQSMDLSRIERWPGGRIRQAELALQLKEWVDPPDLKVSERKVPPAVKPKKTGTTTPAVKSKTETKNGVAVTVVG